MSKPKRDPLEKERFLQGNRQKFGLLFLFCSFIILTAQVFTKIDPVPYLQFLTVLAGVLLAGLTGSDVVKAYKVSSSTVNENIKEEVNIREERLLRVQKLDSKDIDDEAFEEVNETDRFDR